MYRNLVISFDFLTYGVKVFKVLLNDCLDLLGSLVISSYLSLILFFLLKFYQD